MSMFSNPIQRSLQPKRHEGSAMRSVRDADDVSRSWVKNRTQQKQNNSDGQAIGKMQQEIMRLRRRIVGGGGGFNWNGTKEFFMAPADDSSTGGGYVANDVVTVSPENVATIEYSYLSAFPPTGIGGRTDPDAGISVWSRPGTYVCLQECDGTHIPQWPAPAPNDISDPLNFWWPISYMNPFRGTWGKEVLPFGIEYQLGTATSPSFFTRFADGDIVHFTYQQNTPPTQQFMIPFVHRGHDLIETEVPDIEDIKAPYGTRTYSQGKWTCSGFSFICGSSPLNQATMIVGF